MISPEGRRGARGRQLVLVTAVMRRMRSAAAGKVAASETGRKIARRGGPRSCPSAPSARRVTSARSASSCARVWNSSSARASAARMAPLWTWTSEPCFMISPRVRSTYAAQSRVYSGSPARGCCTPRRRSDGDDGAFRRAHRSSSDELQARHHALHGLVRLRMRVRERAVALLEARDLLASATGSRPAARQVLNGALQLADAGLGGLGAAAPGVVRLEQAADRELEPVQLRRQRRTGLTHAVSLPVPFEPLQDALIASSTSASVRVRSPRGSAAGTRCCARPRARRRRCRRRTARRLEQRAGGPRMMSATLATGVETARAGRGRAPRPGAAAARDSGVRAHAPSAGSSTSSAHTSSAQAGASSGGGRTRPASRAPTLTIVAARSGTKGRHRPAGELAPGHVEHPARAQTSSAIPRRSQTSKARPHFRSSAADGAAGADDGEPRRLGGQLVGGRGQ
jgi:hypothetical protein